MKLICTTAFLLCYSIAFAQTSLEQIALKNGPYAVGFSYETQYDSSRNYRRLFEWNNQILPRPIAISMWYPAEPNTKSKLTVLDYMRILKVEEEWENLPDEQILNWFYYANTEANQSHLNEMATATRVSKVAEGSFPLIIYTPSYQASSIENFALCEYLASQGYVVVSSPSHGPEHRYLGGGNAKDMENQAQDAAFLIKTMLKKSFVDAEKIGAIGFSFGGLANASLQMKNRRIDVLISLDGTERYAYGTLEKSPYFDMSKVNIPYVHMSQKDIPEQVMLEDNLDNSLNTEFFYFDSLTNSDAQSMKFHDMTHAYFSTLGVLFQTRDSRQDKSDDEIMNSYNLVCRYTLNILDRHLKNINSTLPADPKLVTTREKSAPQKSITFQDFHELAAGQSYEDMQMLYQKILMDYPDVKFREARLNNLGLQLTFHPDKGEYGIRVLTFATALYPNSANLFDSLAEAHLFLGNYKEAIKNFEKSLALYPGNENAKNKLKQLSK